MNNKVRNCYISKNFLYLVTKNFQNHIQGNYIYVIMITEKYIVKGDQLWKVNRFLKKF